MVSSRACVATQPRASQPRPPLELRPPVGARAWLCSLTALAMFGRARPEFDRGSRRQRSARAPCSGTHRIADSRDSAATKNYLGPALDCVDSGNATPGFDSQPQPLQRGRGAGWSRGAADKPAREAAGAAPSGEQHPGRAAGRAPSIGERARTITFGCDGSPLLALKCRLRHPEQEVFMIEPQAPILLPCRIVRWFSAAPAARFSAAPAACSSAAPATKGGAS